ncbi:Autophagy protein, partial [Desmophyllum pertusum]
MGQCEHRYQTPSRCSAEPPVKQGTVDEGELSSIMTEAMSFKGELNHQLSRSPRRDLFLFPDDELGGARGVGKSGESDEEEEDSDDDFCILEHPDKEPEGLSHEVIVKCLTDEQVNIVENHFTVPIGPSDQLCAPSHFYASGVLLHVKGDVCRVAFVWLAGILVDQRHVTKRKMYFLQIRLQYEEYPGTHGAGLATGGARTRCRDKDRLAHSQINKFLYQYTSEACPKQSHANMVRDLARVGSVMSSIAWDQAQSIPVPVKPPPPPSDWVTEISDAEETLVNSTSESEADTPQPAPTFFRSFIFSPEVPIRLDYQGKRVDMEQGTLAGLLIGLGQLNCSELRLKRLCCRSGLLGIDRVMNYALSEWLADIRGTQLPGILGGVGPVHIVPAVVPGVSGSGVAAYRPVSEGWTCHEGAPEGGQLFHTSSAMAFLELTNRAVQLIQ